jgi:glycine cleavage system H lipoate-binding protein
MKCPFLSEKRVRFCTVGPYRKPIVESSGDSSQELCSGPAHLGCRYAQDAQGLYVSQVAPPARKCPHLAESLVEYCSASSVSKFVPYNDSDLSRCRRPAYRYCDLFLALSTGYGADVTADGTAKLNEGIEVPSHLYYSRNHLWLDQTAPGSCHIGIDGFMAAVLGHIDQVTFLSTKGTNRPTVILTVKGADLPVVFPCRVPVRSANLYLRAAPQRLLTEPYTSGWLFEGGELALDDIGSESMLLPGVEAAKWIGDECRRLSTLVHEQMLGETVAAVLNDGGSFEHGLCNYLARDKVLSLFNEFFSPYLNGSRRV